MENSPKKDKLKSDLADKEDAEINAEVALAKDNTHISQDKEIQKEAPTWIKALRTYRSDVEEALQAGKGSLTRIVLAERTRQDKQNQEKREEKKTAPSSATLPKKERKSFFQRFFQGKESVPKIEISSKETEKDLSVPVSKEKEILVSVREATKEVPYVVRDQVGGQVPRREDKATSQNTKIFSLSPRPKVERIPTHEMMKEKESSEETDGRVFEKNIIVIIAGILLLAVGFALTYGAYLIVKKNTEEPLLVSREALIVTEKKVQISLGALSSGEILQSVLGEIDDTKLAVNEIEAIYFVKDLLFSSGGKEISEKPSIGVLGPVEIFFILKNKMPPGLVRSFSEEDFLFGLHMRETPHPFLIARVNSFENAFSGMLKWERFMFDDLSSLFALKTTQRQFTGYIFEDVVLKNRDTRILMDSVGEIVLIYAFVDKETIVITTNEETFDEIMNRLKTPKKITR